ncbi:MAG TPA: alpha/beta hydrolase [Anaerolineae bacterium]|nr:alpha/beta hydrolase [Anaerolineae bacterium]
MIDLLLRLIALATAAAGALTLADLRGHTSAILLWAPKLLESAVAPWLTLTGGLLAVLGLRRRDPLIASAGLVGAALATGYVIRVIAPHDGFEQAFGPGWATRIPDQLRSGMLARRWTPYAPAPAATVVRNVPYGVHSETGKLLLADLWRPPAGVARSGLGVIYVHGGAWRLGEKDKGTSWMFRRLASQGHTIMDIDYTLAPASDVPGMVQDVKRAVIWLKRNGAEYGVDAQRVALMGGSAGGHLALLAAYTPNDPALQPDGSAIDTSLRGVVSFYGPADFIDMYEGTERTRERIARRKRLRPYGALLESLLQRAGLAPADAPIEQARNYIAELLGVEPADDIELYQRLSPLGRVGPHCPPTLLLQGTADIFGMGPSVQRLHQALRAAGVPSVLVEFPRADHAFDLVLPQVSPAAQAAVYDVERFLALMT